MAIGNFISRLNSGGTGKLPGMAGTKSYNVNNRRITTPTGGFSEGRGVSQRLEMRRLQSKLNTGVYEDNIAAEQRLQNKIANHASEVYNLDKTKLTKAWRGTGGDGFASQVRRVDPGRGADMLEGKVNTPFVFKKSR